MQDPERRGDERGRERDVGLAEHPGHLAQRERAVAREVVDAGPAAVDAAQDRAHHVLVPDDHEGALRPARAQHEAALEEVGDLVARAQPEDHAGANTSWSSSGCSARARASISSTRRL